MKSQEGAQGLMDAVYMNVAGSVCRCLWCDFLSFVTTHLWGLKSFMPQTVSLAYTRLAEPGGRAAAGSAAAAGAGIFGSMKDTTTTTRTVCVLCVSPPLCL